MESGSTGPNQTDAMDDPCNGQKLTKSNTQISSKKPINQDLYCIRPIGYKIGIHE